MAESGQERTLFVLVMLYLSVVPVFCADTDDNITKMYSKGKIAHQKEQWSSCVKYMGNTIGLYNRYKQTLLECAVKCKKEHVLPHIDLKSESLAEYILKGNLLSERNCFIPCQKSARGQMMGSVHKSNFPTEFELRKPYLYLHHCLNKIGQAENAASAAYTFLLRNPSSDDVLSMLAVYRYENYIFDHMIIDMEERPYMKHRREGEVAYRHGKWTDVVKHFEAALKEYYIESERCQAQCEIGYTSTSSGLTQILVDGITDILQCQRDCEDTLSQQYGQTYSDYLMDHYLFLQAAYATTEDYTQSIEAAITYLAFKPEDQRVQKFRNTYLKKFPKSDSEITPRKEAIRYVDSRKHIEYLLDEILGSNHERSKYRGQGGEGVISHNTEENHFIKTESRGLDDSDSFSRLESLQWFNVTRNLNNLLKTLRGDVTLTGESLKHDKRVVMDDIFTKEECEEVMRISQNGVKNAGYYDYFPTAVRPNFAKELFTGIDIMDCWNLVLQKQLKESDVDLLIKLSEKTRQLVIRWFNETRPIYHDYTQFTCREALEGKQTNRTSEDLSHPIHGDSCDFKPDEGVCSVKTAAYPWRTYSAVLYFNDNFEGGKFFFANADKSEQVSIVPKCGRMVAFPSDHLHGVKAITKGKRCAATVWFTASKIHSRHRPTWSGIIQ